MPWESTSRSFRPPPQQCGYAVPPEIAVTACRMVNDGVAAFAGRRPDRLVALGTVPLSAGGAAAADELDRCMGTLGCKGVQILTHVGDREISDAEFAPFWAKAERLGGVVMIHPGGFTEARRFGRYYFNNVIGNPLDTTIALHYLIFDGVLDRHPNLKVIAAHGGGYLPAYSGRIDHAWGARSDSHGDLQHAPTTYLKRVYVDAVVFTPHQLEALVELLGPGHVLMGTRLSVRHGRVRPAGASGIVVTGRGHESDDCGRQRAAVVRSLKSSMLSPRRSFKRQRPLRRETITLAFQHAPSLAPALARAARPVVGTALLGGADRISGRWRLPGRRCENRSAPPGSRVL